MLRDEKYWHNDESRVLYDKMRSSDIFQMKKALLVIIGVLFAFVGFSAEKTFSSKNATIKCCDKEF